MWQHAGMQVLAAVRSSKNLAKEQSYQLLTIGKLQQQEEECRAKRVAERDWEMVARRRNGPFIIFPPGNRKANWDFMMLVATLYVVLVDPFRCAFSVPAEGANLWFELCLSVLFVGDFLLNWHTAYLDNDGFYVIDKRMIAQQYIGGWVWVDLPSCLPLEILPLMGLTDEELKGSNNQVLRVLRIARLSKVVRLLHIARLARVLKLIKLDEKMVSAAEAVGFNLRALELFRLVFALLYITHFLAFAWRLVAGAEWRDGRESFLANSDLLEQYGGALEGNAFLVETYVECIMLSISLLLVIGYQNLAPSSLEERLVIVFALIFGTLVFGYVLSTVSGLLRALDPLKSWKSQKRAEVREYLQWRKLPPDLYLRVMRFREKYIDTQESAFHNEKEILGTVSPMLRDEVYRYILAQTIGAIPLLNQPSHTFQLQVYDALSSICADAGDVILGKGFNNVHLYILFKGTRTDAHMHGTHGTTSSRTSLTRREPMPSIALNALMPWPTHRSYRSTCWV